MTIAQLTNRLIQERRRSIAMFLYSHCNHMIGWNYNICETGDIHLHSRWHYGMQMNHVQKAFQVRLCDEVIQCTQPALRISQWIPAFHGMPFDKP